MVSSLCRVVKTKLKRLLETYGYTLSRFQPDENLPTESGAFKRIAARGHSFNTIIDIGASDGRWSSHFMNYFPSSYYFLIEAQPVHKKKLEKFCGDREHAAFVLTAAGDYVGEIYFDASDPFGGQAASNTPYEANCITVPVTTVDHEVNSRKLQKPFLIKFDTHGFEIPILRGALETLSHTEVIIMECYNFNIAPEGLQFFEICQYLLELGFRCVDMYDPLYRPYDSSFWQMDLVFIKKSRHEFSYLSYK